ncbi:hypothetical protein [Halobacillus ihumii]|uniref:hypothetical protein n=1 Tax=Halobacillus ihumii TaxID=2686092 RepID=UPI0013D70FE0|nr:hypothetical protein [Halobacillus ihumii]
MQVHIIGDCDGVMTVAFVKKGSIDRIESGNPKVMWRVLAILRDRNMLVRETA